MAGSVFTPHTERRLARFVTFASFVLVVVVLRLAADVLIPVALATLLAFLLSPMVVWFTRRGVPKILAISATVTVVFALLGGLGWVVITQAVNLAERLPDYEENIRAKIERVRNPQTPEALSRTTAMVEKLQKEMEAPTPKDTEDDDKDKRPPLSVRIEEPERSPLALARGLAGPILGPLAIAGIVIVLVVAMLFQRDDLRDRFIKIVSAGQLNLTTRALDDAARRVTRYLLMQLVVNATYGIPVGIALALIGVPNALLWGVLATLLRFIPFLGPWVAAAFPVALTLAVDPGWTMVLSTLAVFVFMEVVSNNLIEVKLYGASTGISNLALLVAAVFWTWLWGPAGLILSTPLTVCLLVLGRHAPGLKFLSMLLGSGPVLEPPAQFYQRMLSMDSEEMIDLARKFITERSLTAFYDEVFVPALRMAEHDREEGALAEVRQKFIIQGSRELIDELTRDEKEVAEKRDDTVSPQADDAPVIVGIPARDDADELVALMLAHVLRTHGLAVNVLSLADAAQMQERPHAGDSRVMFISALPPSAVMAARHALRRLRRDASGILIVTGVWDRAISPEALTRKLGLSEGGEVVTTLGEAAKAIVRLSGGTTDKEVPPAIARERTCRGEHKIEERFEQLIRELAQAFDVPLSLVSLVERDTTFWKDHAATLPALAKASEATSDEALCGVVMSEDDLLVVENVAKDARLADNAALSAAGVHFYVGVALRRKGGHPVGVLCVSDTKSRPRPENAVRRLRDAAGEIMQLLEDSCSTK
jgi:predicted PurR-regulated permease PerM